jgi:purine-nucleoside phosphorylase
MSPTFKKSEIPPAAFVTISVLHPISFARRTGITANLKVVDKIPFREIKCLSNTTVDGHTSNLHLVETKIGYAMIYQGRRHYYEGVGWDTIRMPVLLAKEIGCNTLIVTNAAGGISDFLNVGDIMMIEDHINLMNSNPLIGQIFHPQIPRFPDQTLQ